MKMNQSRQLNRREVQSEGERLGSSEGAAQHRRQQAKKDRDSRNKEWEAMSGRAADSAAKAAADAAGRRGAAVDDADVKRLTDQASDVLRKAQRKADRAASNRYGINDYYNPEGQQRNYERSLKSVPRGMTEASSAVASGLARGCCIRPSFESARCRQVRCVIRTGRCLDVLRPSCTVGRPKRRQEGSARALSSMPPMFRASTNATSASMKRLVGTLMPTLRKFDRIWSEVLRCRVLRITSGSKRH